MASVWSNGAIDPWPCVEQHYLQLNFLGNSNLLHNCKINPDIYICVYMHAESFLDLYVHGHGTLTTLVTDQ